MATHRKPQYPFNRASLLARVLNLVMIWIGWNQGEEPQMDVCAPALLNTGALYLLTL